MDELDGPVSDRRIADALRSSASRFALRPPDGATMLDLVVAGAGSAVPAAAYIGVTEVVRGRDKATVGPLAASDPRVLDVARAQAESDEGPCVDSVATATLVTAEDTADIMFRWPVLAPYYEELGIRSLMSFPLLRGDDVVLGTVGFYADHGGAFSGTDRLIGELFAGQAAGVLTASQEVAGLDRALQSRDLIGQAKGVLMREHHVDADRAFAMLVDASQHANIKLVDAARWVTTSLVDPGRGDVPAADRS